jgi:hypothetical protein
MDLFQDPRLLKKQEISQPNTRYLGNQKMENHESSPPPQKKTNSPCFLKPYVVVLY